MMTRAVVQRVLWGAAVVVGFAGVARAQGTDARWRAWTGCWTPTADAPAPTSSAAVCVLPGKATSAVEIVSVDGSRIADRMLLDADGAVHAISRDGCTGTQTARWSPGGTRVYVQEAVRCEGGIGRTTTTVMSFDQQGRWLDVRGVSAGANRGVAVMRYEPLRDSTRIPPELRPALALRGAAANDAILAASAPLTLADISDVATSVDTAVATTWLVERAENTHLSVNGRELTKLADRGVPSAVIDVLVALAYPQNFALSAGTNEPAARAVAEAPATGRVGRDEAFRYGDPYGWFGYVGPWYSPFYPFYGYGYGPYYYGPYAYGSPYGPYGLYGSPYFGAGYGYYAGGGPIIIVNSGKPGGTAAEPHGRVIKGQGYTSGSAGERSPRPSSSASSSSSGGSSSGSQSSGASSSSGSSGTGRTAVRKPPPQQP